MTTYEQAITMSRLLPERGISRFVLVTSPIHMPRSIAVFRAMGLDPIPSSSPLRGDSDAAFWTLMPDRESLSFADGAIHEFKSGAGYLALHAGCDVLPIHLSGTFEVLGKGRLLPRRAIKPVGLSKTAHDRFAVSLLAIYPCR